MAHKTVTDDVFGPLVWDNTLDWWYGSVPLALGNTVRAYISVLGDDLPDLSVILCRARVSLERLRVQEPDIRRSAAAELLAVYNDEWAEAGAISEAEFADRLALESVTFYPDGSGGLCYADGGLFRGHVVLVGVGPSGEVGPATVAG